MSFHKLPTRSRRWLVLACLCASVAAVRAQDGSKPVYRCPGPPVLYTDGLTPQEAREKGCRTIEGAPVTVVPAVKPKPTASASRAADSRVNAADQRARDSDARRILGDELKREEDRLAALKRDFNNGEPERQGDEHNYQRYLDRVAEMKAAIARKESDIESLRRELAKLPQ